MEYIILVCFLIFIIFLLYISNKIIKIKKNIDYTIKFSDHVSVLEYHMHKAFEIIYKDKILVYSLDAQKIPEKEINAVSEDFVRLTLKFLGPRMTNHMIEFYGDEDTLMFNMIVYFTNKYEDDEIRKRSIDNLSDDDDKQ